MKIENCKVYTPVEIKGTNEIGYIYDRQHPWVTSVQVMTETNEIKTIHFSGLRKNKEWIHGSRLIPPYGIDVLILTLDYDGYKIVTQGVYLEEKLKFYMKHLCWLKEAHEVYWKPLPNISKPCLSQETKEGGDIR